MRILVWLAAIAVASFCVYEWNELRTPVALPDASVPASAPVAAATTPATPTRLEGETGVTPGTPTAATLSLRSSSDDARDPALVAACEKDLPATEIVVKAEPTPVTEVNNEDIRTLTMTQQSFSKGRFTMGLTTEQYNLKVLTKVNSLKMPNGTVSCIRPSLYVTLSEPFHKVSIAKEFAPGTCIFNEIRTHEYRHVAVHQQSLEWARGVIEQEMKAQIGNTIYYGDPKQLQQQVDEAVNTYWLPRAQQLHAEVEKEQLEIDTPQEYERLSSVCDGAARQIIANTPNLDDLR